MCGWAVVQLFFVKEEGAVVCNPQYDAGGVGSAKNDHTDSMGIIGLWRGDE